MKRRRRTTKKKEILVRLIICSGHRSSASSPCQEAASRAPYTGEGSQRAARRGVQEGAEDEHRLGAQRGPRLGGLEALGESSGTLRIVNVVEAGNEAAGEGGVGRVSSLHTDLDLYNWVSIVNFLEFNLKKWCKAGLEIIFGCKPNGRLLTASHGHSRISAMNSAQAEERAQPTGLYLAALAPAAEDRAACTIAVSSPM